MPHRLMLAGLSAWILWSYNMPSPEWLALGATETQRACVLQMFQLSGPLGVSASWTLRCLPAGLSPDQVHGLYDVNMARSPQAEGE